MIETLDELLAQTVYTVEATSTEQFYIWKEFVEAGKHIKKWEQLGGYLETIGLLDGRPVCILLNFNRLDGHIVCFYEATSQVVDHVMVESWIEENVPVMTRTEKPFRNTNCNAMNFASCYHRILELNKEKV